MLTTINKRLLTNISRHGVYTEFSQLSVIGQLCLSKMQLWLQTSLRNGFINLLIRRSYIEMRMWNCEIPKALWWEKKWQLNPLDLSLSPLKRTASTCRVINVQMCVCVCDQHTHYSCPPSTLFSSDYTIPIFFLPHSLSQLGCSLFNGDSHYRKQIGFKFQVHQSQSNQESVQEC